MVTWKFSCSCFAVMWEQPILLARWDTSTLNWTHNPMTVNFWILLINVPQTMHSPCSGFTHLSCSSNILEQQCWFHPEDCIIPLQASIRSQNQDTLVHNNNIFVVYSTSRCMIQRQEPPRCTLSIFQTWSMASVLFVSALVFRSHMAWNHLFSLSCCRHT